MREIKDLDEIKRIELGIMKHVHLFCEENSISYCLAAGTLIGAIRHKGFIPWDDDIDIFMPRDDYIKFAHTFPEFGEKHHLYIVNSQTNPRLLRAMMKICDDRTVLFEPQHKYNEPIGVFIDVWPVDGTPRNKIIRKANNEYMMLLHRLFYAGLLKDEYARQFTIRKKLLRKASNIIGQINLEQYIEKRAQKYPVDKSGYIECYADKTTNYKYTDLFPVCLAPFEDTYFYIPVQYDIALRKMYGDYMMLPPEEERVPRHIMNTYWKNDNRGEQQ